MGKRRERRLANQSNGGRRVKLDLSAEPPGDSGGYSAVNEELGEDFYQTLSKSPSSSGPEPQNPLLLLGQYSDDEFEVETDDKFDLAPFGNSTPDLKNKENTSDDGGTDPEKVTDTPFDSDDKCSIQDQNSTQPDALENSEAGLGNPVSSLGSNSCNKSPELEEKSALKYSSAQLVSGWHMVLHEESNQYYYWNTVTGETSWEVPFCSTEAHGLTVGQKNSVTENDEDVREPCIDSISVAAGNNYLLEMPIDDPEKQDRESNLQVSNIFVDGSVYNGSQVGAQIESSDFIVAENCTSIENCVVGTDSHNEYISPSMLIDQCERLLAKLEPLRRNNDCTESKDSWTEMCIIELQVRISDMRALLGWSSTLLPFWRYSEKKLKDVEYLLNQKIYDLAVSEQMNDVDKDHADKNVVDHCIRGEDKFMSDGDKEFTKNGVHNSSGFQSFFSLGDHDVNTQSDYANQDDVNTECLDQASSPATPSASGSGTTLQMQDNLETKVELHSGEDVDMDIDMELEDSIPVVVLNPQNDSNSHMATEQPEVPVPLPPEDEWIPPPPPDYEEPPPLPPDDDQAPPPPPDESLGSSYVSLPSIIAPQYQNNYSISLTDPAYQVYENVVTIPTDCLYVHPGVSQVVGLDTSLYYGHGCTDSVVDVIPSQHIPYYNIDNCSMSQVQTGAIHMHGTVSSSAVVESNTYQKSVDDAVLLNDPRSVSFLSKDLHLVSDCEGGDCTTMNDPKTTEPSVPTATEVNRVKTTSAPSKALRSKKQKRTPAVVSSVRLNKKVSSLVDKWKAAKEELHSDEEPENAFELLEKKRQREIEEWKAKQIASGEAKDNANFQPLGGDWRDRVKRKKSLAETETGNGSRTEDDHSRKLSKLSKDLPSGWQVYWDEASKQAYYGHSQTLETSWSRPSK